MKETKGKVFVGMSGGVDSSVSAALLKHAGYDVTGVFIKVWQPDWVECTWKQDRLDALRVAAVLNIPFITLDLEKEYKENVVDYMVREYSEGRTPNPDVMCNKHVKFGSFFDWALKNGADYVATGHYASIGTTADGKKYLQTGTDASKDQSYFLWTLSEKHLEKTLFPVGNIEKSDVRKLARSFKLPTAAKKDSQGLCFIGKVDLKEFLSHFISSHQGNVLDEKGRVIGQHDGALFFTIGQRHGFTIHAQNPHETPRFVIAKDVHANTITVSSEERQSSQNSAIKLRDTVWSSGEPLPDHEYMMRTRYRQALTACTLKKTDTGWEVYAQGHEIYAPGQSLVLYEGNITKGGGIIV
jgi:tRNA-specific 2-thiouridylase